MRVVAQAVWLLLATGALVPTVARATLDDGYQAAAEHYRAGRWADACQAFDLVLTKSVDAETAARARFYRGEALMQLARYRDARAQFAELLSTSPEHRLGDQASFRSGEAAYLAGDAGAAREDLQRFVERYPDHERVGYAQMYLAQIALDGADPTAARQCFAAAARSFERGLDRQAIDDEHTAKAGSECVPALVTCYARMGRLFDAENILKSHAPTTASVMELARAHGELAEAAYSAGDYELAAREFQALTQATNDKQLVSRGYSGLGWCHYKQGEWDAADAAFKHALEEGLDNSPMTTEAALMRGRALERRERFDEALATYERVLKRVPEGQSHVDALWCAARVHEHLKHDSRAIAAYRQLLDTAGEFAQRDAALYRLAWLENTAGHESEALELWKDLREEHPTSRLAADATLRLAEAALAAKQYDDATQWLDELKDVDGPNSLRAHALALRARVAMAEERYAEVDAPLGQLDELLAESPDPELALSSQLWRAEASYRLARFDDAVERLQAMLKASASERASWSPNIELRLAQSLAQLKRWSECREVAERIAEHYPDFDKAYEALYLVGRSLVADAELARAREVFAKVARSQPAADSETADMARFMIGETYFHQEDFASALAAYQQAQRDGRHDRWQAAALLQAGKCREALGQWNEARDDYEQLARRYPDSPLAEQAHGLAESARRQLRTARGAATPTDSNSAGGEAGDRNEKD